MFIVMDMSPFTVSVERAFDAVDSSSMGSVIVGMVYW